MSVHYLLDGYNIAKKISSLKLKKLKASRDSLIKFIETYHPQGSLKNKITIIFDGNKDTPIYRHSYPFDVYFTKTESADDRIIKIVQKSKNTKNIVVVTDDRELKSMVGSIGAMTISVDDFLDKAKRDTNKIPDEKRLSFLTKEAITKELGKIWLKRSKN